MAFLIDPSDVSPRPSRTRASSKSGDPPCTKPKESGNKTNRNLLRRDLHKSTGPSKRTPYTQRRFPCLSKAVEHKARRTVSIATDATLENLAKCHPQAQSPLFPLPQELRDLIYAFALAPWNSRAHAYGTREYYYRPDCVAKHMVLTDLLLTCRRVWLEANAVAIKQWRPRFWYGRGPELETWVPGHAHRGAHAKHNRFLAPMTDHTLRNVTNLQLHAQMFRIEPMRYPASSEHHLASLFDPALLRRGFAPRKLRITIRHTDWWYWESDEPLRFEDGWVQALLDAPLAGYVEIFELELETLERKLDQLQPIIERLTKLSGAARRVNLIDAEDQRATRLICASEIPVVSHWTGRNDFEHSRALDHDHGSRTFDYHVALLTWRAVSCPMPSPPVPSDYFDSRTELLRPDATAHIGSDESDDDLYETNYYIMEQDRMPREAYITWTHDGWLPKDVSLRPSLKVREADAKAAQAFEGIVRERFFDGMAVLEVMKTEERWRKEGSLLEFA